MNLHLFYKVFPFLIVLNTIFSVGMWSRIPLGSTTTQWFVNIGIILFSFWFKNKMFRPRNSSDFKIVKIYFIWMIIGVIRGVFVAENYWEWKQLIAGTIALSLPILLYCFQDLDILHFTLRKWIKYAFPLFIIFFILLSSDAYHFYLSPIFLLTCFLPTLPRKWKILFLSCLLLMLFIDWGARSQVIKALFSLLVVPVFVVLKSINVNLRNQIVKKFFWTLCFFPLVLLTLSLTGYFNPFEEMSSKKGKLIEKKVLNGQIVSEDLTADTRTFIYKEVAQSALKHNYIFWGRTPARGNDSVLFGTFNAEELKTGKFERHRNEVCFPNVFTWLGIIGMILYCFMYIKGAYLSIYKSNSVFLKIIGIFIMFHYVYGWVEDTNNFDITNIAIWMAISMGYSERFRLMNDSQFIFWFKSIFIKYKYESTVAV